MTCLETFFLFYVIDLNVIYIYAHHSVHLVSMLYNNHGKTTVLFFFQKWLVVSFDFSVTHIIAETD